MVAKNKIEEAVIKMVENGIKPTGIFFDVLVEMTLREEEETGK